MNRIQTWKVTKKSKTSQIIIPKTKTGNVAWLDKEGTERKNGKVILFKRVSVDFKTQEKTENETIWTIGTILTHPSWNPKGQECGKGKFHACSRPYFCDEFRSIKTDIYVAIEIFVKDLYAWPEASYPHKISFRSGKVLYQCNKFGKRI